MTTPFFAALRCLFPHARIDLVVEKAASPLVKDNPDLDHIFISNNSIGSDISLFSTLRKARYDVCFDLFGNPRSALIALFSKARLRVGFDFRGRKYAYHVRVPSRAATVHEVEFHLDALRYFGLNPKIVFPKIWVDEAARKKIAAFLRNEQLADSFLIALNPAGSWPAKRWPISHFVELATLLKKELAARFIVLWGPGEHELAKQLQEQIGSDALMHPPTTLIEQAALLEQCHLFIGNDSGPMHIAAAAGIPTIGLYGPTNAKLQSPFGRCTKAVLNEKIPCLGCNRLECPLMDCMNYLAPKAVASEALNLVKKCGDRRRSES